MKTKTKTITAVILLLGMFFSKASAELTFKSSPSSPFAFNWIADASMLTAGAASNALLIYMDKTKDYPQWNGITPDINEINPFDRWAARPYNDTLHTVGTVTCGLGLVLTPALIAGQSFFSDLPKTEILPAATMYVEAFLFANGIKELLKREVLRVRPYMYFEGYPQEKVTDGDFQYSWPSGHTTLAFLGASFTCSMMNYYYPQSKWRIPVNIGAFTVAAATGVLRMLSGNHFLTDVLTGAVIGTACGFAVPFIHSKMAQHSQKTSSISQKNGKIQNLALNLLPAGMCVSFNF